MRRRQSAARCPHFPVAHPVRRGCDFTYPGMVPRNDVRVAWKTHNIKFSPDNSHSPMDRQKRKTVLFLLYHSPRMASCWTGSLGGPRDRLTAMVKDEANQSLRRGSPRKLSSLALLFGRGHGGAALSLKTKRVERKATWRSWTNNAQDNEQVITCSYTF